MTASERPRGIHSSNQANNQIQKHQAILQDSYDGARRLTICIGTSVMARVKLLAAMGVAVLLMAAGEEPAQISWTVVTFR